MGRPIIKLAGHYLEWSTISEAPGTYGMTLNEFKAYYRKANGDAGMRLLAPRLARVEAKGTSAVSDEDADETIWLNRAGPGEIRLSKAEIIEWYVRRKKAPTAEEITERRASLPKCNPCVADDGNGGAFNCVCWGTGVREPTAS